MRTVRDAPVSVVCSSARGRNRLARSVAREIHLTNYDYYGPKKARLRVSRCTPRMRVQLRQAAPLGSRTRRDATRRQACARKKGRQSGVKEQCTAHTIVLVMAGRAREGPIQDVNVITDARIPTRSINPLLFNHKGNLGTIGPGSTSHCAFGAIARLIARRAFIPVVDPSCRSSMTVVGAQHIVTFHAKMERVETEKPDGDRRLKKRN